MKRTEIRAQWPAFLPHQLEAFLWEPVGQVGRLAHLGGWGAAKTESIARVAIKTALRNSWHSAYGAKKNPTGIVSAPTYKILNEATVPKLLSLLPSSMILKIYGPPKNWIILSNGFKFILHSGEGELEGVDACCVMIDEIHHSNYTNNPKLFGNLMMRLRDPFARSKMMMLVAGLPESGFVRDLFAREDENSKTILTGTRENPFISEDTIQQFLASCPAGMEQMLIGGRWMTPVNAVYPQFDPGVHIVDTPANHGEVTHIGMDVGNRGAIVFGQRRRISVRDVLGFHREENGLEIVDQLITDNDSVEAQCHIIKTQTNWNTRGCVICVDPTIRRDELYALRSHFPESHVIKRERGDEYYPIETGIRAVQRALKDAVGNVRLTFNKRLLTTKNGLVSGVETYRRNEKTGEPVKDQLRDHLLDAARYLVCEMLPMAERAPSRSLQQNHGRWERG